MTSEKTQKLVVDVINDPGLASKFQDKHFGRPPFSFIQKIVDKVIEKTGFLSESYSSKELEGISKINTYSNRR